jgi:hypothetical protein
MSDLEIQEYFGWSTRQQIWLVILVTLVVFLLVLQFWSVQDFENTFATITLTGVGVVALGLILFKCYQGYQIKHHFTSERVQSLVEETL